jgi:hypothetical protein
MQMPMWLPLPLLKVISRSKKILERKVVVRKVVVPGVKKSVTGMKLTA